MRLPVSAISALHTAGALGGAPGPPTPPAALTERTFRYTFAVDNLPDAIEAYARDSFTLAPLRAELTDDVNTFLLAVMDGEKHPNGYAKLRTGTTDPSVTGPDPVELQRPYVGRSAIGHGSGAALDAGEPRRRPIGGSPNALARGVGASRTSNLALRAVAVREGRGPRVPAGIGPSDGPDHGAPCGGGRMTTHPGGRNAGRRFCLRSHPSRPAHQ